MDSIVLAYLIMTDGNFEEFYCTRRYIHERQLATSGSCDNWQARLEDYINYF